MYLGIYLAPTHLNEQKVYSHRDIHMYKFCYNLMSGIKSKENFIRN